MNGSSWLVMSQGPQPGQSFMLDRDWLTLGRDPSNDIEINDPQISRQHTRITRQGRMMVIEDLGSTNGTFVNGMRLTGSHVMANGDTIGLGDGVTLTYYEEGQAADATETVVGRAAPAPPPPSYELPPQPVQPQPPPIRTAVPPPPPAYTAAPPPPPATGKKSMTWLWVGCGLVMLGVIVACVGVFALDYFGWLPSIFYEPLRWLGFF